MDGYIIVYSITDRRSYQKAVDLLYAIRYEVAHSKPIIIVANKSDLERSRVIGKQGLRISNLLCTGLSNNCFTSAVFRLPINRRILPRSNTILRALLHVTRTYGSTVRAHQWCSDKFGAGVTIGGLG